MQAKIKSKIKSKNQITITKIGVQRNFLLKIILAKIFEFSP